MPKVGDLVQTHHWGRHLVGMVVDTHRQPSITHVRLLTNDPAYYNGVIEQLTKDLEVISENR